MIADFYIVKRRSLDLPGLYQPHGRYRYQHGLNWRAAVAILVSVVPAIPGLAYNVNPSIDIGGAIYIANFNWYYGIIVAAVTYMTLSMLLPATETLVSCMIEEAIEGEDNTSINEKTGTHSSKEAGVA